MRYKYRLRQSGFRRESLVRAAGCRILREARVLEPGPVPMIFGEGNSELKQLWTVIAPYHEGESFVAKIKGARVWGNPFAITSPGGEFFEDLVWDPVDLRRVIPLPSLPVRSIADSVVLLGLHRSRNYYHWLVECLPRLMLLEGSWGSMKFLVPRMKSFHRGSMEMLGISESQLIEFDPDQEILEVGELVIPSRIGANRKLSAEGVTWLRKSFNFESDARNRMLFVSRGMASTRRLINENAIQKILAESGFERVEGDRLSFREQVALFSKASAIVGAHGAGLANSLFCAPGVPLLEFSGDDYINPCCAELASSGGLPYGLVIGKSDSAGNYEIDATALNEGLQAMDAGFKTGA